jgi:hypothetical protein
VSALAGTPVPAVHSDAGETVGWPRLAATVRAARARLPAGQPVAVLTANYGQAGAVDRFAADLGPAYSGHNAYWDWGPPGDEVTAVVAVGLPEERLRRWFGAVEPAGRVDNGVGLRNDEQGAPVWTAQRRLVPWSRIWPELRRLG